MRDSKHKKILLALAGVLLVAGFAVFFFTKPDVSGPAPIKEQVLGEPIEDTPFNNVLADWYAKTFDDHDCSRPLDTDFELRDSVDLNGDDFKESIVSINSYCGGPVRGGSGNGEFLILQQDEGEYKIIGQVHGDIASPFGLSELSNGGYKNIFTEEDATPGNTFLIQEWQWNVNKKMYEEVEPWPQVFVEPRDDGAVYKFSWEVANKRKTKDVASLVPADGFAGVFGGGYFRKDITGDDQPEIFIKMIQSGSGLREYEILRMDHNAELQNLVIEGQKNNPTWISFDTIEYRNGRIYMTNHGSDSRSMTQYRQNTEQWGQQGNTLIREQAVRFKLNANTADEDDCEVAEITTSGSVIKVIENKPNCEIWTNSFDKYFEILAEEQKIKSRASDVIQALKNKDLQKFASFMHPTSEVRFHAATTLGVGMTRTIFLDRLAKNEIVYWGSADGSGMRVEQSIAEFFRYYGDYSGAEISFNAVRRGGSTSPNSFIQQYADKPFMNYYSSGENDIDWGALNLILDKASDGQWYLIGIQQDQWAI